jgi:DNA polymerase III subunit alpha
VKEKYGDHHMVSIVTFGTFALRSSIRDIARVMKIDHARVTGIIQSVINEKIDETDHEMMRLLRVAKAIEGLPRHTGTHAAGMILAKQDLTLHIPLQKGLYNFYQSQLEASELESLGLLKMDFLGIRNLAVIDEVVKEINRTDKPFSIHDIPLDDKKTYDLLSLSETSGIFQLESSGMRAVLRKLKPDNFEDIVAILALYRPGPMDNIDDYIDRRNGASFSYIHPGLEPILSKTYGIIVYQEQIMRIAHEFAGYSLAEADLLRRGISKKDKKILEEERVRFVSKCKSKGYLDDVGLSIYDYIVKFADYGFNRSHSVAYALVAYQMAYLKANYFSIFMTILLSSVTGNEGLTSDYLNEIRRKQIRILPPDINLSTDQYVTKDKIIYLPLLAIKSIGRLTVSKIIEDRALHGPYQDFQTLKLRLKKEINEKNLEMLIHSGALDHLGMNHQTMMNDIKMSDAGYENYITDYQVKTLDEYAFSELAGYEKEALGFNLLYSPIQAYQDVIKKHQLKTLSDFQTISEGIVLAYIKKIKTIKTKQGKPMAFILLDDGISELEVTLFTETYQKYDSMLTDDVMMFKIKANLFNNKQTFVLDAIKKLN